MSWDDVMQDIVLPENNASEAKPDARFQLLAKLVSSPEQFSEEAIEYKRLDNLIHSDFLKLCAGIGIPGESALFNELLVLLSDLRELIEFPHLANKNILAIGGGFSSGKSRFLNSILGQEQLLPVGLLPTTAIPTFLTSAKEESIHALNAFDRLEPLTREDLSAISHAFNTGDSAQAQGMISFYHILKLIQIRTPCLQWENIALLDTPGYSKPHADGDDAQNGTDAGNTDEEKAREHLSKANHLIWVIPATAGTFQQSDIAFLRDKVKWDSNFYLLINMADQRTDSDLKRIYAQIQEDAVNAGFHLDGMSAYSSRDSKVYIGDNPRKWFESINKKCKFTQWRGRFKAVFAKIIQYNTDEENRCKALKAGLDPIYFKGDEVLNSTQLAQLKETMKAIEEDRKAHALAAKQFIAFGERVEKLLDAILKKINVFDETVAAVGVEGRWQALDGSMPSCKKGDTFAGSVKEVKKFGKKLYIELSGWKDLLSVNLQDVEARYTTLHQWERGRPVRLTVYDVNYATKNVIFTVTPA